MRYPDEKEISGCGLAGIMNQRGERLSGEIIIEAIATMDERANGLGGGFAGYGIYPEFPDFYAFHIMYENESAARETEEYLADNYHIEKKEIIPHRHDALIRKHPLLRRYFVKLNPITESTRGRVFENLSEDERVFRSVMEINTRIEGAFVFSSGKNMGIFKGVGYPRDIGEFYKLDEYAAYIWTAHGRFPTNSVGWWGGAHPFGIIDWSVVHNGEISSYGINKRYLENFGYRCTLFTDTEVMVYLFDLLVRKHGLDFEIVAKVLAPPLWEEIERLPKKEREFYSTLRMIYGSALVNGPFAIITANSQTMMGLNDRIKLRPLVAARKGDFLYIASEESAIRAVCPHPEAVWMPPAGEPVIGRLNQN